MATTSSSRTRSRTRSPPTPSWLASSRTARGAGSPPDIVPGTSWGGRSSMRSPAAGSWSSCWSANSKPIPAGAPRGGAGGGRRRDRPAVPHRADGPDRCAGVLLGTCTGWTRSHRRCRPNRAVVEDVRLLISSERSRARSRPAAGGPRPAAASTLGPPRHSRCGCPRRDHDRARGSTRPGGKGRTGFVGLPGRSATGGRPRAPMVHPRRRPWPSRRSGVPPADLDPTDLAAPGPDHGVRHRGDRARLRQRARRGDTDCRSPTPATLAVATYPVPDAVAVAFVAKAWPR